MEQMTGTVRPEAPETGVGRDEEAPRGSRRSRITPLRIALVLACGAIGFVLVTQLQATEGIGTQLEAEREEDLARILANLTAETDRLQGEYNDLRLTLLAFEQSAEEEELALRSLEERLEDLAILAGTVEAQGEGVVLTIDDPLRQVGQVGLVDAVEELRGAGAEAIEVNGTRLVASSAFSTRNGRLVVDGQPLDSPYRLAAIGPADDLESALNIQSGVVQSLEGVDVDVDIDVRAEVTVPARAEATGFVFGEPVEADAEPESGAASEVGEAPGAGVEPEVEPGGDPE